MEDSTFDVIVLGTGLTESIVAAALSKWGFKVAHIDQNPYYGGEEASLTLEEFVKWVDTIPYASSKYSKVTRSDSVPSFARQYSICLCPTINPSIGPFIDALIHSGVSKYSGFRLLERVSVYDGLGAFRSVPGSKEDVFKNKDISLIQKRRLMRFLTFALGDFEKSEELEGKFDLPFTEFLGSVFLLNSELVTVITYALAYASSPADPTISVLSRIQRYLRSVGRYGSSPFLVGHYGGVGEISQGFCRAAAVNGTVYILGREIKSISPQTPSVKSADVVTAPVDTLSEPHRYSVTIEDIPQPLYSHAIVGSARHIPNKIKNQCWYSALSPAFKALYTTGSLVRCVAIVEHPIVLHSPSRYNDVDDDDDNDGDDSEEQPDAAKGTTDQTLDTALLVFPPGSMAGGSADSSALVFVNGEGALSAPKGKYILYISLPVPPRSQVDPSKTLEPYLEAVLKLGSEVPQEPLFTAFYLEEMEEIPPREMEPLPSAERVSWIIPPQVPLCPLGDVADAATQNADIVFREVLQILDGSEERYQKDNSQNGGIWPRESLTDNEDEI